MVEHRSDTMPSPYINYVQYVTLYRVIKDIARTIPKMWQRTLKKENKRTLKKMVKVRYECTSAFFFYQDNAL